MTLLDQSTSLRPVSVAAEAVALLTAFGVDRASLDRGTLVARSPLTGEETARLVEADAAGVARAIEHAHEAHLAWRTVPAPRRGELVRLLG
ncbi:MAG: aldehyde dehydrogenase family protein, partial [Janthinobacterium lividum]